MNIIILNLIIIIVLCGIIGGIGNTLREITIDKKTFLKNIVLGIIASTTVPLFMQLVSSKIMEDIIKSESTNLSNYFVFTGFCIIAAFSSISFLTSISGRVLQSVKDIKEDIKNTKSELETLKNESVRIDNNLNAIAIGEDKIDNININQVKQPEVIEIMASIQNAGKNFIPVENIKKDSPQDNKAIEKNLTILKDNNLIKEFTRQDGTIAIALSQGAEEILDNSKRDKNN